MVSRRVWEMYWKDFIELEERQADAAQNENSMVAYMPFGINDRGFDTKGYNSPIVAISLPHRGKKPDSFVLIDDFCRNHINGREERIEKLEFMSGFEKIFAHHEKVLQSLNEACKSILPGKYFLSIIYKEKHYVIPLCFKPKNEEEKSLADSTLASAKVLLMDLTHWIKINKDQFDLDDVDKPIARYKEKNGIAGLKDFEF